MDRIKPRGGSLGAEEDLPWSLHFFSKGRVNDVSSSETVVLQPNRLVDGLAQRQEGQTCQGPTYKKAAQEQLEELRVLARRNPEPEAPDQTVLSVIERYIEVRFPSLAETTVAQRKPYLQSFAEMHGFRGVEECGADHIEEWLNAHSEWESDWTKRDAVMSVQTVFNWAARARRNRENPFRGLSKKPGAARRDITPEEFQAILRGAAGSRRKKPTPAARFRQVLFFLYYTGCRPAEARSLLWSDVDFGRNIIILRKHKTIRMQREPRPRVVPLHPVVVRLLRSIQKRNEGEHVFLTYRGTPWKKDTLSQRLRRARAAAGVPDDAKLYGLRHAFGTRGILNGCDIKTVSVLMGHTDTRVTQQYAHIADKQEFLANAIEQINPLLASSRRPANDQRRGA